MDGKIFGIPLIIIVLVGFIALFVDVPMVLLHRTTQQEFADIKNVQLNQSMQIESVRTMLITPTATPEAEVVVTPTPVKVLKRSSVVTPVPTE